MRCKTILHGFPLKVNISLLVTAVVFVAISSLFDKDTLRIAWLAVGGLLTLVAVMPSLFWHEWERVRKGKGEEWNPDTIIPRWKQFCQLMGIEEDIKVKVFPNLRNAYANHTIIEIGQPVLHSLDSVSIKAVFAHELAHIKGKHDLKRACLLIGVLVVALFAAVRLFGVPYSSDLLGLPLFMFSALLIWVDSAGIAMRFILWPFEYSADSMADQCVKQGAVASALKAIATLRKIDVTRDFYGHPSVNKRIANLGRSQKARLRRWHTEL